MIDRQNIFLLVVVLWLSLTSAAEATGFDHSHGLWNELLQTYVVDQGPASRVKYAPLKQRDAARLDTYLQSLSAVKRADFDTWSKAQKLAFLINAYNAFTVKLIIDHYPVESIKDIGNVFRSSWKIKFFILFGEQTYLDYIEHSLIRGDKNYVEPRIHFALVCASVGCPKLQSRAFTAEALEVMLESATKAFLSDVSRNRYDASRKQLQLSSIFKWYGEDFAEKYGSVQQFVAPYLTEEQGEQQAIVADKVDIKYLDYDWNLNEAK